MICDYINLKADREYEAMRDGAADIPFSLPMAACNMGDLRRICVFDLPRSSKLLKFSMR